ncbi:class I SAM-dependent methyltransferase [Pseudomonas viridiflava]|uniref:class I SAM-dependent methyltransferase n=1 Tax=Pseudomonas viridiflava TaxID=33069 RepID=UPI000F02BAE2|nr:class I SAM-dependent methyltransferase [Pseudomonas viridiflava]
MTEFPTLQALYDTHTGFVSDKWASYIPVYARLFNEFRDTPLKLLEIGVQNGGSLEIWSKYFHNAEKIVGCDINQSCDRLQFDSTKISLFLGDINDTNILTDIKALTPEFDIIVDDGSHLSSDIIKSFSHLFSSLAYDGLYIAEDLHCGYWAEYEGGLDDPTSCISFFKTLADIVNFEHWGIPVSRIERLSSFCINAGLTEALLSDIYSVEFINSICVVRRKRAADIQLGSRIVRGQTALVVPVQHLDGSLSQAPVQRLSEANFAAENNLDNSSHDAIASGAKHDKNAEILAVQTKKLDALEAEQLELREQLTVAETQLALLKELMLKNG